jgi:ABC-2 type transport system ATP-binding protein
MDRLSGEGLCFAYPGKIILEKTNIYVKSGDVTGLLGSNGAGKTTFFDLLCGLRVVQSGRLKLNCISQLYLSQTLSVSPVLQMKDVFRMLVALNASRDIRLDQVLMRLDAWAPGLVERYINLWEKKCGVCSYGETRWFFTSSLLAMSADFVVLDEPTAGVDPECRFYMWQCMQAAANEGAAVLVSSHNVEEIVQNTDAFYMLAKRKFKRFASRDEYLQYYKASSLDEAFIQASKY